MRLIDSYYKIVLLPDEVKAQNKIKVGAKIPRFDCIKKNGNYNSLQPFVSIKGQLYFYKTPAEKIVQANLKRLAEFCLTGGRDLNFGSLYQYPNSPNFAFSYPNNNKLLFGNKENPLFPFSNDLYLLIINSEFTEIEILVLKGKRNFAELYYQKLINGELNEELEQHRKEATTFFSYVGYDNTCQ